MRYSHVFNTWAIVNLLHPLFAFIISGFEGDLAMEMIVLYIPICIGSFILSSPSLVLAYLFMRLVTQLPFDAWRKYFTWLFLAASIPFINVIAIGFIFQLGDLLIESMVALPSILAVATVILIRHKKFMTLIDNIQTNTQLS